MKLNALSPDEKVDVYVYQKGQMIIPTDTWVYGSDKKTTSIEPNTSYTFMYHILQDEEVALDQRVQRCHEPNNSPNISNCVALFVEQKFNCSLPLLGGFDLTNACEGMEWNGNASKAFQYVQHKLRVMTELEIFQKTGCMPSCQRQKIHLNTIEAKQEKAEDPKIWWLFSFRDGQYNLHEEYYVYDKESLIADIGGFLGLLLGHSLLSMYHITAMKMMSPQSVLRRWLAKGNPTKSSGAPGSHNEKK